MAWCRHTTALSELFFFTVLDRLTTTRVLCWFLYFCGFLYARQQDMIKLQWKTNKQNVSKTKQNKAREKHKRIKSDLNKLLENHLYFISVYNARIFPRNIAIINLFAWAHGHITRYISAQITPYMTSHVVPSYTRHPVIYVSQCIGSRPQHIKPSRFYLWMGSHWPHHVKCQHLVCHMWRHTA